ncbi:MAG: thiol-disulfide isomerase [Flavobacteriales bacterium]|jgi:thioredoxin-related protein|nr:thiol-disulfide isomerase [Candidatus Arcticimaribacter sp.]|tara:strand:- start:1222 stop:1674 length:453 start_codon:yes stop_codon:yes gene_type:complete
MKNNVLFFFLVMVLLLPLSLLAQDWRTNWDDAKSEAEKENKKLILVFSGSDWCIPCIKLEKEVWENSTFNEYAKDNYVLFRADFPKRKKNKLDNITQKRNDMLAAEYNPKGYFPFVVIIDSQGNVRGLLGYEKKSPKDYITRINQFLIEK